MYLITETPAEAVAKIRAQFTKPDAQLSKAGKNKCYYRHPEDARPCAVGVLIPDEAYRPRWDDHDSGEDQDISSLHGYGEIVVERTDTLELLETVQGLHDTSRNVPEFIERLDEFTKDRAS